MSQAHFLLCFYLSSNWEPAPGQKLVEEIDSDEECGVINTK